MNTQLTEMDHAEIAVLFYEELTSHFQKRGKQAFILMTKRYGEERGSRMTQRAIRDGKTLNFQTYREYTEWQPCQETIQRNLNNQSEIMSISPDYKVRITRCPWAAQFASMNMKEAGNVYCSHIDASLVRGFNPALQYETLQNLNTSDCCIQICPNAYLKEGTLPKHPAYIRDFNYHCAHLYWTFTKLTISIFAEEGRKISENVLNELLEDKRKCILDYKDTDFTVLS